MTPPEVLGTHDCFVLGVVGLEGGIAGHSSSPSTPGDGDSDFLNGLSVASIRERRTIGDLGRMLATGRLGSGLSGGLSLRSGRGMPLCALIGDRGAGGESSRFILAS